VILPDVLAPGLRAVLCGSAAGAVSARVGAPYAGPGNKFWDVLHRVGLTDRRLQPHEYERLLDYGLGLTDLCKTASGSDAQLPREADDPDGLLAKVERFEPAVLAFVGRRAARVVLRRTVVPGPQPERFGRTAVWVLPSTSGLASGHWDEEPWRRFAAALGA
jgi:TDG/mug DNA glycosylase family protein